MLDDLIAAIRFFNPFLDACMDYSFHLYRSNLTFLSETRSVDRLSNQDYIDRFQRVRLGLMIYCPSVQTFWIYCFFFLLWLSHPCFLRTPIFSWFWYIYLGKFSDLYKRGRQDSDEILERGNIILFLENNYSWYWTEINALVSGKLNK